MSRAVKQELRDNRGIGLLKKEMLAKGYLVLDSSYTTGSDPNTMRNFGPNRNAVYNITAMSEPSTNRDSEVSYPSSAKHPYDEYHAVVLSNDYTKNIS